MQHLDTSEINDNRHYNYDSFPSAERIEYPIILQMVKKNSRVIDLGCGNGSLLEKLIKEKNVTAQGIELSKSGVEICKKKGLNVSEGRIDVVLPFNDEEFDYAICNVTIQMVMYPEILLKEMKRVARYQIISVPNFAYFKNRIELLIHGRMPRPALFGYEWFSTGHIHHLSIKDFQETSGNMGLRILKSIPIYNPYNPIKKFLVDSFPNLFSLENVFLLTKKI